MNQIKDEIAANFGKFIRDGRKLRGLYQQDVAEHLGVTQAYVSHLESGDRDIDLATAIQMCSYLNLDMNEFLQNIRKKK